MLTFKFDHPAPVNARDRAAAVIPQAHNVSTASSFQIIVKKHPKFHTEVTEFQTKLEAEFGFRASSVAVEF